MFADMLSSTRELCQVAIENFPDGICLIDNERKILLWNTAAEKITGYTQDEMTGQEGIGFPEQAESFADSDWWRIGVAFHDGFQRVNEMFFLHKRGYRVPLLVKTVPIVQNDEIAAVMAVFTDNSIHVQQGDLTNPLTKLVMTDQLTGLSNKRHIELLLESRLEALRTHREKFGVLFASLDGFYECNSRYGYEAGDCLLIALADTMRSTIRDADVIGRWTGEEFLGIFDIKNIRHLKAAAEKIRVLIEGTRIEYMGEELGVTVSVGVTMAKLGDSVTDLTERAMSLMHVSKISGENCATLG